MSKIMKDVSGKEGLLITVDYPPGGSTPIHRHNAHSFLYVLEGSIVMQLKGGKPVTLTPGQTFYEGPNDIHIVSRNASNTEPAKYVVFLVKDNGAPFLIPVKWLRNAPVNGMIELAGPELIRQDELVRRFLSAKQDARQVVTDVHARYYGLELNDQSLTPGDNPRIAPTRFEDWLSRSLSQK
jgi:quercetin dioxygenase-like cupin family protein